MAAKKQTKSKKPVLVQTLINPSLKKRWDQLSKLITNANREEAADFDRKWEAVADVLFADPPLYLAGGYSTDKDFFERFLRVDRFTGLRRARVARFASPKDIEAFGDTKIDAVLDYLEAKSGPLKDKLPVDLAALVVPVVIDGKTSRLTLNEATREQIRAATRALRQKSAGDTKASPRGSAVLKAISRAGLKVDVVVRRNAIDLRSISFEDLVELGRVLAKLSLPAVPPSPK
jgi:cell division protein ZapA (FtsZ GTPase activity inhibitor)